MKKKKKVPLKALKKTSRMASPTPWSVASLEDESEDFNSKKLKIINNDDVSGFYELSASGGLIKLPEKERKNTSEKITVEQIAWLLKPTQGTATGLKTQVAVIQLDQFKIQETKIT